MELFSTTLCSNPALELITEQWSAIEDGHTAAWKNYLAGTLESV